MLCFECLYGPSNQCFRIWWKLQRLKCSWIFVHVLSIPLDNQENYLKSYFRTILFWSDFNVIYK